MTGKPQVWFLTGSQHLYGPETLAQVADQSQQIQRMLISRSWKEHAAGRKGQAIATGMRACLQRPLNAGSWKSFAALLMKRSGSAG